MNNQDDKVISIVKPRPLRALDGEGNPEPKSVAEQTAEAILKADAETPIRYAMTVLDTENHCRVVSRGEIAYRDLLVIQRFVDQQIEAILDVLESSDGEDDDDDDDDDDDPDDGERMTP